jgi:hypothetical protein
VNSSTRCRPERLDLMGEWRRPASCGARMGRTFVVAEARHARTFTHAMGAEAEAVSPLRARSLLFNQIGQQCSGSPFGPAGETQERRGPASNSSGQRRSVAATRHRSGVERSEEP